MRSAIGVSPNSGKAKGASMIFIHFTFCLLVMLFVLITGFELVAHTMTYLVRLVGAQCTFFVSLLLIAMIPFAALYIVCLL